MNYVRILGVLLFFLSLNAWSYQEGWLSQMIQEQSHSQAQKQGAQQVQTKNNNNPFFDNHGLILFYGSRCPHCRQFAPVLKQWSQAHHVGVLALALDNQPLPEFPNFFPATSEWINAAFQGSPINYPALFVVNPKSKFIFPVGYGSMSFSELNERMGQLISKIQQYEAQGAVR